MKNRLFFIFFTKVLLGVIPVLTPALEKQAREVVELNRKFFGFNTPDFCKEIKEIDTQGNELKYYGDCNYPLDQLPMEFEYHIKEIDFNTQSAFDRHNINSTSWPIENIDIQGVSFKVTLKRNGYQENRDYITLILLEDFKTQTICFFPQSLHFWSSLNHPNRFAGVPVGKCGEKVLTLSDFLISKKGKDFKISLERATSALAEIEAWKSSDPEKIKYKGNYNLFHPYGKFFMLNSFEEHTVPFAGKGGYIIHFPETPLSFFQEQEQQGHGYLVSYDGNGSNIEFVNIDKEGIENLTKIKPVKYYRVKDFSWNQEKMELEEI